tara:strand:+ start:135 stop:419 length:285 start_codon:yes stop_codon:yes gene_type:complete
MLRKDKNGKFIESGTFSIKYQFSSGKKISLTKLSKSKYNSLLQIQSLNPVNIMTDREKGRIWWMFQGDFYVENEGLTGDDIKAFAMGKPKNKTK